MCCCGSVSSFLRVGALLVAIACQQSAPQIVRNGQCPLFPPLQGFEISRYTGKWWVSDSYPSLSSWSGKCWTSTYFRHLRDAYRLKLHMQYTIPETEKGWSINADVKIPNQSDPGKFVYTLPIMPWTESSYRVLATDYLNFAVEWKCENKNDSKYEETLWILSRDQFPRVEVVSMAYQTLNILGLDGSQLKKVDQLCVPPKQKRESGGILSWLMSFF